jgi:thioredoxin reductase
MQAIPANPFAPPMDNGLNDASPLNYTDVDFTYPYDVVLTANQFLRDQSVSTTNDADFAARAIVIAYSTGSFNLRIADSQGYYLSNGMIVSANIQGDAASPYPLFPEILIPAGGRIGIDIQDTSGNPNTIELLFRGVKRYRVA